MTSSLSELHKQARISFLLAHANINRNCEKRLLEANEVPLEVYDVLVNLEMAPDHRLRMNELADRVVLSRSGLTRLVDRIEAKGWIRREECPSDRRGSYAILTESGLRQREATWRVYQPLLLELWSSKLTDQDAETLIEILGKFHEPAKVPSGCGG